MSNLLTNAIDSSYNFLFHPVDSAPVSASNASKRLRTIGSVAIGIFSLFGIHLAVGLLSRVSNSYRDYCRNQAETAERVNELVKKGGVLRNSLYVVPIRLSDSVEGDPVKAILDQVKEIGGQVDNPEKVVSFGNFIYSNLGDIKIIADAKLSHSEKLRLYVGLYEFLNNFKNSHRGDKNNINLALENLMSTLVDDIITGPNLSFIKPSPKMDLETALKELEREARETPHLSDATKEKYVVYLHTSDPSEKERIHREIQDEISNWAHEDKKMALQNEIEGQRKVLEFISGDAVHQWVRSEVARLQKLIQKMLISTDSIEMISKRVKAHQERIDNLNSLVDIENRYIADLQKKIGSSL
jgi:hypothetical protein